MGWLAMTGMGWLAVTDRGLQSRAHETTDGMWSCGRDGELSSRERGSGWAVRPVSGGIDVSSGGSDRRAGVCMMTVSAPPARGT